MKKKISVLLALLLCLFALPLMGGCAVEPWTVDWSLDYYVKDGVRYSTDFNTMDFFATLPADAVRLCFYEDGTVAFTDCDGRGAWGKYSYVSERARTDVKLTFEDGRTAEGWCSRGYFDGVWYDAYLLMDGVEYYFEEQRDWGYDAIASGLEREGRQLEYFEASEKNVYGDLRRGEISFEDAGIFVTFYSDVEGEFFRYNLARTDEEGGQYYTYTVYEYDRAYAITEAELREGACAVKYHMSKNCFALLFRSAAWQEDPQGEAPDGETEADTSDLFIYGEAVR